MRMDELDYDLPEELIAQKPANRRDAARLMVVRGGGEPEHRHVRDLPELLQAGDLLVLNDTRVIPARFHAIRAATGGAVEGLFVEAVDDHRVHLMLKTRGRPQPGERLAFEGVDDHHLDLLERQGDGSWTVRLVGPGGIEALLERIGAMPLPPYIRRQRDEQATWGELDRERYQTIYARSAGAVAAPTAGLHFTGQLLERLRTAGVEIAWLTLHVGLGTFAPVRTDTLEAHDMHSERFTVPADTLRALAGARAAGRRIICVGTTTVRALESLPDPLPTGGDYEARTQLLIQPGFQLRFTDGLLTNFHLPRSTLLALVAAKTGLARLLELYHTAIDQRYRFYSYGDAMLVIEPLATTHPR